MLSRLVATCTQSVEAEHALAVVERRLGNLDASRAHFESVLRAAPRDANVYNNVINLALSLKNAGRSEDAQILALRVTQLEPTFAKGWHALGIILWQLRQLDAAATALSHALDLTPRDPKVLHARAQVEADRGGAACRFYERALAIVTDDPELMLGAGVAQFEAGNAQAALETLEQLTKLRPDWVKGHAALAQLRWQAGDTVAFARSFEEALRCRPSDLPLLVGYFGTLMRAGLHARVLDNLSAARARIAADDLFDRYEAVCASEAGDVARAERAFSRQAESRDSGLEVARVRHLLRTRRPTEAAAVAEQLTRRSDCGTEGWSYLSLAWRLTEDKRAKWLDGEGRFVQSFDCREMLPELSRLAESLRARHHARLHPFDQSPRGGTQSDGNLFLHSETNMARLRGCMESCVARYIESLPPEDVMHPFLRRRTSPGGLGSAYSIWLRAGGFHINHVHPHAWVSSCLYVELPPSLGTDVADPAGWFAIGQPPKELGLGLQPACCVRPSPGKLVMFPSMMWHGSLPFPQGERLTVVADF